mgnify:CR=1 FL=1
MSMIWTPRNNIRKLENDIRSLFSEFDVDNARFALPLDLKETDDAYELVADLPGFSKEDIDIEASSQYIEIRALKNSAKEEKGENYIHKERTSRSFSRRINFDKPIDTKKCKVELIDGVLKLDLPKSEEAKSVKLIPH